MISVNKVRSVVMYLLNKNNMGYLTPNEADTYFQLAQQAIFEELFYENARWIVNKTNRRANGGYSNIPANIREMIDVFSEYSTSSNFTYDSGDNIWSYTGTDFYRTIGISLSNISSGKKVDVEEVSKNMINSLINSEMSTPTVTYPIYTKIGESYRVYPTVPTGYELELLYIRKPRAPKWTYILVNNDPLYNASASDLQDFELPEALYEKLIVKIMQYAGVSLRENDIVSIEANEQARINQTQS